jgi:ERCC4-related helicase
MNPQAMLPRTFISGIRDNYTRGSVGDFLREKINSGSTLSVVSAYFTIYAFDALKNHLLDIERMDFLFGEPRFISALDPERTDKKAFKIEDEGLQLENRLEQKRVARECAEWIASKVNIRSIKQANLLHGKMYHIADGARESAIIGSSNFTVSGLGLGASNNIELNLEVDGTRDREDLKSWFDEIWKDEKLVEDVKGEVLLYLAQLYENHAPEFIYYKTLFHIFEQFLAEQDKGGLFDVREQLIDTQIWSTLFDFQKDGVKGAINKIRAHNGCILADSVGLGKTFEALAVIKYFELRNDKVLVLCPKKLKENWTVYQAQNNSELNPFLSDRFGYTVLAHTDLSRSRGRSGDIDLEAINWGNYDLVVIDESHNFRNNIKGRSGDQGYIKSRYERLIDDIINAGVKTKVLLLSATPVNNDLKDLRNQIYLITGDNDAAFTDSIGISSLRDTLATAQRTFTEWANDKTGKERKSSVLLERLGSAFFKLLDELTIARSRKHVQKYYRDTLARVGEFPKRNKPISVFPDIDTEGMFLSYDKLNDEISNYRLSLFSPSQYVREQYGQLYADRSAVDNFTQENREHFLIGMMKVNFLKRLESSVSSFAISMERTMEKIKTLEEKIKTFKQVRTENLALDFEMLYNVDAEDEELRDAMQTGTKLKYRLEHLDVDRWLRDLAKDRKQLNLLYLSAKQVTVDRDAKLKDLKQLIADRVKNSTRDKDGRLTRKVLVFTAFADTSAYLYESLLAWARDELGIHIATVSGGASGNRATLGGTNFNEILTNFSPVAKKRYAMKGMPQDEEIDLLIATDCISEGQNLQDCDTVVNYDIHWNPVRLIQRFGRVDRIGSRNRAIQLVNFWPTEDLNKYINLKNRVEARMALVDVAATGQDDILSVKEIEELVTDEIHYRDKQLLRLKEEVLDLEDFNETVALNEFTLDDFRAELAYYIESNRMKLQDAPLGLYAVVSARKDIASVLPGVIFCLRQKGETVGNETVNPLQPHFLVYVRDDGEVRYTFAQAKQILDIFRALCADAPQAHEDLCKLFDEETQDGKDMSRYTELLKKAVPSITHTFRKRNVGNLLSGRGGTLISREKQANSMTDFDLITWLVIR